MKLSDWAKRNGINYQTAYRWYKAGRLPASAYQADTGTIIITDSQSLVKQEDDMTQNISTLYKKNNLNNMLYDLINTLHETENRGKRIKWFNKEDKYILGCILPGFAEDDVKINVKGDVLSINALANSDEDLNTETFLFDQYKSFNYTCNLPNDAVISGIKAEFKNGILYLTVPRAKHHKEEIEIVVNKK